MSISYKQYHKADIIQISVINFIDSFKIQMLLIHSNCVTRWRNVQNEKFLWKANPIIIQEMYINNNCKVDYFDARSYD